jgi:hypothetical protein
MLDTAFGLLTEICPRVEPGYNVMEGTEYFVLL